MESNKTATYYLENPKEYIAFLETLVGDISSLKDEYYDKGNVHDIFSYLDEDEVDDLEEQDIDIAKNIGIVMDVQKGRKLL